jgi:hypothetical protein
MQNLKQFGNQSPPKNLMVSFALHWPVRIFDRALKPDSRRFPASK